MEELVAQRVYGLALGCEDLNDHDDLRPDSFEAVENRCANSRNRPKRMGLAGRELSISRSLPASVQPSCAAEPDPVALLSVRNVARIELCTSLDLVAGELRSDRGLNTQKPPQNSPTRALARALGHYSPAARANQPALREKTHGITNVVRNAG